MKARELKLKRWCEEELLDTFIPFVKAQEKLTGRLSKLLKQEYKNDPKALMADGRKFMLQAIQSKRVPKDMRKSMAQHAEEVVMQIFMGLVGPANDEKVSKEKVDMYIR